MIFNEQKKRLTQKQFDSEVERLVEWVQASVSPFEGDTAEKQAERVRRAREDQDFFNETYLPHYFNQPSPAFHREMEELIDEGERQQRPVACAAPRGHAKSTRVTLARTLKKALYRQKHFALIISDTEIQARGLTVSIRVECEHNPRIVHDFGEQRTGQWAAGDFVIATGCRVMARGDGQDFSPSDGSPGSPPRAPLGSRVRSQRCRRPTAWKSYS